MSLKGCIKKAGKNLDVDDRKYMTDLMAQGRPDQEVLNRLEQNILAEQSEVIQLLDAQGVEVLSLGESLTSRGEAAPLGAAKPGEVKVSSKETSSTVETGETISSPSQATSNEAKPSTNRQGEEIGFGSSTNPGVSNQSGDSQSAKPLHLTRATAKEAMDKLSENSPIIKRFLDGKTGEIFLDTFTNSFMADVDVVNVTGKEAGKRLDLNTKAGLKRQTEVLEHEIMHANTIGYLQKHLSEQKDADVMRDIKYLGKAVTELKSLDMSKLSPEARARVEYILEQPALEQSVAEFIAVMGAETDVTAEIMAELGRKQGISESGLKARIEALLNRVKDYILAITDADLRKSLDIDKLAGALVRTVEQGTAFREQQYQESRRYAGQVDGDFQYGPKTTGVNYARKASFD